MSLVFIRNVYDVCMSEIESINDLVPSKKAYITAWLALIVSGIAGGFIGYALNLVFIPQLSGLSLAISTTLIAIAIIYSMNILVSLALQASVEWKARKSTTKASDRPSKIVRNQC